MRIHFKLLLTIIVLAFYLNSSAIADKIYLRSGTIDTKSAVRASAAVGKAAIGAGYYIVAFKGTITPHDKQSLTDVGAQIIEYVPENAFIVRIEHSKISEINKLSFVEWVGRFKPEYKVGKRTSKKSSSSDYLVTLFPGQSLDYMLSKGQALGIKKIDCIKGANNIQKCRIAAKKSQISEIAKIEGVAWIEPYSQPKLCNNIAAGISGIPAVRQDLGLYGAGQLAGAADGGLDTGNLNTISADFSGRIDKTYTYRRPNEWSDLSGHGTHVVGSLLGAGALSGSNPGSHSYNDSFAGYAPEAHLVFQSIGDDGDYVFPPLHLSELFQPAYDDGVRVHTNSWGSAVDGEYTLYSSEVDQFVWDHKDFAVVFAAGNEAEDKNQDGIIDRDNLCAPSTAKNCISVGASESNRTTGVQSGYGIRWPESYPTAPIYLDLMSNNPSGMAAFSGRGPTDDGRVKPDICAPGTNIVSNRSQAAGTKMSWGVYDSHYVYMGGTSMSTPQVAGAAVLTREYFQKEKGVNPSAALIKAALLNGAADMAPGQYGTGSKQELFAVPDASQGWGRLNLKQSLNPDLPVVNEFTDDPAGLETNEYRDQLYTVIDVSVPLKATLVWSDYPGSVHASKELVNDLDLMVISPTGRTFIPGVDPDRTNNVEQVRITNPELGVYTIRVTGYNIPNGPQDYALTVAGGLPITYISGKVTSSSGAGVQGAVVSLISSVNGLKRVTTDSSGKYITHVAPGRYSIQVGKPGWTFTPRSSVIEITGSPVTEVNFSGQGDPGSISGTVTRTVGGVVSHTVESPHPYMNNCDKTYVITAHEDTTRIRVHFAEIELMDSEDKIMLMDGNDSIVYTYTGKGEDITSPWVDGRTIKIRITSNDYNNLGYGFYIDGYETDLINQGGLDGTSVVLSPGNFSISTANAGQYAINSIPPGTYTVTPVRAHWKFQPSSKTVDIPAGGSVSGIDFSAFPPGSITGTVHITTSSTKYVNIETEHPYTELNSQTWVVQGDPNAARIRLHFSEIETEPGWDFVHVKDGNDNYVESYTSTYYDLWTPWISGSTARIDFESDEMNNYYGFLCDKYEMQFLNGQLAGVKVSLFPDGRTTTTSSQGTFSFEDVDAVSHNVSFGLNPWSFDPSSVDIKVSSGIEEQLNVYANVSEITSASVVKLISDGARITLKNQNVSAVFNGYFYVEDSKRSSGMRIVSTKRVNEGNLVDITGTISTSAGERYLNAEAVTIR